MTFKEANESLRELRRIGAADGNDYPVGKLMEIYREFGVVEAPPFSLCDDCYWMVECVRQRMDMVVLECNFYKFDETICDMED